MATPDQEYADAFNDEAGPSVGGDDFGVMPGDEPDAPVAVVIDVDAGAGASGTADGELAANAQAAAEAKAVADRANLGADDAAGSESTATQEAAQQAGKVDSPAEEAAESTEPLEASPDLDDLSDVPPKEMQKAKSWQGRLKKIEADLKSKMAQFTAAGKTDADANEQDGDGGGDAGPEAPMGEALEQAADKADAAGKPEIAEAIEGQAEQVEAGQVSFQDAMASLAADFGDEFVQFIQAVAQEAAGRGVDAKMAPVQQNVADVISHLQNTAQRDHFETIHGEHPDFADLYQSPDFKAFAANYPDGQRIMESGSAREINGMLAAFKAQKAAGTEPPAQPEAGAPDAPQGPSEQDIDAAAGVRSQGMRLPQQPGRASDDYEKAWEEF